ncbi:uncharacterized protein LOC132312699 isoform X2 [Cornus florida]|uniref:uncharacterized protein LOC132312699 isoform X2 n=1 Tax=Cornus florida TaxID=4283 RepID=UPI00289B80FF|nr:uncharacterized protein LOC132312699 isoform X2 [Cornus florida]
MAAPSCYTLSNRSSLLSPPISGFKDLKLSKTSLPFNRTSRIVNYLSRSSKKTWRISCFRKEESSEFLDSNYAEAKLSGELNPEFDQQNVVKENWVVNLRKVMLLWIASFWLVGSWIIPFLAHSAGFRKETLTYRGQALYSLLTDVAEGLVGIAILHRCLAKFYPLPSDWFRFSLEGNWQFDVGLGCLMFPLVNRLSQVNLNLLPILPSTPVTVSSVEQSIVARDPVAMALYAVVVSVCAPVWEEIVFRGFLLPSLTRYMPVWCAILVSSVAFALAHFNVQRMLPLVFLGVVMGAVFARSRNLLASMLLHSLWNAFVFLDLMK